MYLNNFSPEGKQGLIHIIEMETGKERTFQSIKNTAFKYNYNTIQLNKEPNDIPEQILADCESRIGRLFKKITSGNMELSLDEWSDLLYYTAQTYLNVPTNRTMSRKVLQDWLRNVLASKSSDKEFLKMFSETQGLQVLGKKKYELDELSELLQKTSNFNVIFSKRLIINYGIKQTRRLYGIFTNMNWAFFIITDDSCFVTSDRPVTSVSKNPKMPVSIMTSDLLIFPITKKVLLAGKRDAKVGNVEITGETTNALNLIIMANADKYIYSPLKNSELQKQSKKYA